MSEKRFVIDEKTNYKDYPIILDTKTGDWWVIQDTMMGTEKLLNLLNRQQDKITELEKNFEDLVNWSSEISKRNVLLDEKIGRLQQEEKLYAQEILRLNELLKQYQSFKDLGGDY